MIGSALNLLCLQSHSKPECRWKKPDVVILGADQKEHGLWGQECQNTPFKKFTFYLTVTGTSSESNKIHQV